MDYAVEILTKFILCVLLTQMGKTFTTIGLINERSDQDAELGRSIHLIWTMNTLLNNAQFANRLHSIDRTYGNGSVVIFASKYVGPFKHVKNLRELQGLVLDNHTCPRVILMCSNDIRFEDGFDFINILNTNITNIQRAFAYYDELHKYINLNVKCRGKVEKISLRERIEQIDTMGIVHGIMAMTATPDLILQKTGYWSRIQMFSLDSFNDVNYAGVGDMEFQTVDTFFPTPYIRPGPFDFEMHDTHTLGFIRHVLDAHPEILSNTARLFIPGHVRRLGHQAIRNEIFKRYPTATVVVLNGEEKTLEYFVDDDKKTIPLVSPSEEVCNTIARIVKEKRLVDRALVITGYLCVGMGQTLIEQTLGPFTSAIFSHLSLTNDDIYQLFGRCTARSKEWSNYIATNIYCPTKIMNRIIAMETCARNLAKEHNGGIITEADYYAPLGSMGEVGQAALENIREKKVKKVKPVRPTPVQHEVGFETLKEAEKFLTNIFKKPTQVRSFISDEQVEGYTLSTRLNSYYKKTKKELRADDRLTMDFFKKIDMTYCISSSHKAGQHHMVFPVYPTKESPKEDFRYYVRYLPPPVEAVETNEIVLTA
jgi:hypothetical protein